MCHGGLPQLAHLKDACCQTNASKATLFHPAVCNAEKLSSYHSLTFPRDHNRINAPVHGLIDYASVNASLGADTERKRR